MESMLGRVARPVVVMTALTVGGVLAAGLVQAQRASMPVALDPADPAGFTPIFDGKTLDGWDGDPAFWRVEDGALVGQTTAERPLPQNTFIIWRGGRPSNFELRLQFRMNATNSGIQYRSAEAPEVGRWVLKGYQADIDFDNQWTGQLYEERGRGFLALRGQSTWLRPEGPPLIIGSLGHPDALEAHIKVNDWNRFHVIARGNVLVHILNGHVMAMAVDDDPARRAAGGLIGFQIHTGPPMTIAFKDIWLRTLPG